MKTIVFSNDPKVIEEHQKQGEVIVAKDPDKTLKAMEKVGNREEYKVVGDPNYVDRARQLGYNRKPEARTSVETISKIAATFEEQLKDQEESFNKRMESMKAEHDKKITEYENMLKEYEAKFQGVAQEKDKIKKVIKKIVYADNE